MAIETIKTINLVVQKEMNHLPLETIEKVNNYYWTTIRDHIREGSTLNIRVRGFGTITTSKKKLNNAIIKVIRKIRFYRAKSFTDRVNELTEELNKLLKRRNEIATNFFIRDEEIKSKKNDTKIN